MVDEGFVSISVEPVLLGSEDVAVRHIHPNQLFQISEWRPRGQINVPHCGHQIPQAGQGRWILFHQILVASLRVVFHRSSSRKNRVNFGVLLREIAPLGIRKLEGRVLIQKHEFDSLRDCPLNVHGRHASLLITVSRGNHCIAITEIVIERDLKLKTGTAAKVAKQLFLISVDDSHKEILDSRSDWLTRSVEDVQQDCALPV